MKNIESLLEDFEKRGRSQDRAFVIDDDNRQQISFLLKYFFQLGDLDSVRGLCLCGNVGSGKTMALRIIQQMLNEKERFSMSRAGEIANDVAAQGETALNRFKTVEKLLIDDIGEETDKKNYGNKINAVAEVLTIRYDRFVSQGFVTHLSTNLALEQLRERYGERVGSRLTEMFQWVEFKGPDRRPKSIKAPKPKPSDAFRSDVSDGGKKVIADSFIRDIWEIPLSRFIASGNAKEFQDFSMYEVFRALWKRGDITLSNEESKHYEKLGKDAFHGRQSIQCPWQLRREQGSASAYQQAGSRGNSTHHSIKFNAALIFMWEHANKIRNEKTKVVTERA